ncbi:outer membrane protein assembly factor BamE [Desulfobacterota bacterium AH_259_B03_O07]|nr:outer membrane protein assembly factor BamE [Desulfobacterota bacterium AH_259_B03_O07]
MINIPKVILLILFVLTLSGCMSAAQHRSAVQDDSSDRITVGTVQREIRVGMSAAEVAGVLGSPNIVTTDENRRETWIYDKISTDRVYSTSSGGVFVLILYGSQSAGSTSTSQRTLTIIIKFDKDMKVRDFAYHASRF